MYMGRDKLYIHGWPLIPPIPLIPLIHLLWTFLVVIGSVHLCSLLLVNWPLVPYLAHVLPLYKIPTPRSFPDPNIHLIRTTLWTPPKCSLTLSFELLLLIPTYYNSYSLIFSNQKYFHIFSFFPSRQYAIISFFFEISSIPEVLFSYRGPESPDIF